MGKIFFALVLSHVVMRHVAHACSPSVTVGTWPGPQSTLSMIGEQEGVSWQALASSNGIANPNLIYPGQVLCIPQGGAPQSQPAPSNSNTQSASTNGGVPLANQQPVPSGSVADMIRATFGGYSGAALAVANCESGLNPGAYEPIYGEEGVFQFLASTWAGTPYAGYSRYNAWANIQAAFWLFQRDGYSWGEWTCQP